MSQPAYLIDLFIFLSVLICVGFNLFAAIVIYRRSPDSNEHRFFALFFIGLAGFVLFYLFLQDPVLKDISYILQLLSVSIAILGLSLFNYTLSNEGRVSVKILSIFSVFLFISPVLCVVFSPYQFVVEDYGYELIIDPWFMLLVNILYALFVCYALFGLIWRYFKTENQNLKRRLKRLFICLFFMLFTAIIFFTIIPLFLEIHYLKPIGYGIISVCIFVMVSAFKGHVKKKT